MRAEAFRAEIAPSHRQFEASLAGKRFPRSTRLLAWYDSNRRTLPWRAGPGETADPYRVWLSEIMLQQTTVKTVVPYFHAYTRKWKDVRALAAAPLADVLRAWAGLGYYARARNLHACAREVVDRHGGAFPQKETELARLPGIGPYTAAAIAAIAFGARTVPVDGNVERVLARVFAVEDELPGARDRLRGLAQSLAPATRAGDFAQALMDLGATICTPKAPRCGRCPWITNCRGQARGDPEEFPKKPARKKGQMRFGAAFVALRADGAVLVRTRASAGLLGGMSEVPGSAWAHELNKDQALAAAPRWESRRTRWHCVSGVVSHVFTHFALELVVYTARVPQRIAAPQGSRWIKAAELASEPFPTLMRKVLTHAGVLAYPDVAFAPSGLQTAWGSAAHEEKR
jgi:A/G-specific adenine glycosylase